MTFHYQKTAYIVGAISACLNFTCFFVSFKNLHFTKNKDIYHLIITLFAFTYQPFLTNQGFYSLKHSKALYTNIVGGTNIGSRSCDIMIYRQPRYVRKNTIPVFISERTPGENREDLWKLLEAG